MKKTRHIIHEDRHRPWPIPEKRWQYYQEWNDALFLHMEVQRTDLLQLVPEKFHIDSFKDKYYISIVAFKMENIRPRGLPPLSFISDFHEINVRTYIRHKGKSGVYFLNIEAEKWLSALIAGKLSGLPYEKSKITRTQQEYTNQNTTKSFHLSCSFHVLEKILNKTEFDRWVTERYCLYLKKGHRHLRYEIHHKEWELYHVDMTGLRLDYQLGSLSIQEKNVSSCHYSPGVQVVSWKAEKL